MTTGKINQITDGGQKMTEGKPSRPPAKRRTREDPFQSSFKTNAVSKYKETNGQLLCGSPSNLRFPPVHGRQKPKRGQEKFEKHSRTDACRPLVQEQHHSRSTGRTGRAQNGKTFRPPGSCPRRGEFAERLALHQAKNTV